MSGVSLPVTRPTGRALVVAAPSARIESVRALRSLGYECVEADDPYGAMRELCGHRLAYSALILSLAGLYREELSVISAVKRRLPHLEVWLTQTDGRQGSLADGVRLGADGLLAEDGLHRIVSESSAPEFPELASMRSLGEPAYYAPTPMDDTPIGEPVLSADELRALLQDQPLMPPSGTPD